MKTLHPFVGPVFFFGFPIHPSSGSRFRVDEFVEGLNNLQDSFLLFGVAGKILGMAGTMAISVGCILGQFHDLFEKC
jgi:hypothetical protein